MRTMLLALTVIAAIVAWDAEVLGQWHRQKSGVDAAITDVVMVDLESAYAVSRGRSILRTTDAGATWFDLTAPLSYVMPWNGMAFYDSENGVAVGDNGTVFTIRGGDRAGWCRNITNNTNRLYSALHITPANIYVGADSGWIFHSLDSGKTWSSEKISEWPVRSVFTYYGPTVGIITVYALTAKSICSKTEFPPTPWSENVLPQLQGLGVEAFEGGFCYGGGHGFIVGAGGDFWTSPLILRTSSSDTSGWEILSGVPGSGPLYGVSAPSNSLIYACGQRGAIIKSTDGGDSWVSLAPGYSMMPLPDLRAISFVDERHGFVVGDSGTILYTSNGGLTGIARPGPTAPTAFVLEQNYPNPFNPTTTIQYRLAEVCRVTLALYDVLGREVRVLVKAIESPGSHSVKIDAGDLPSGVYFYRLLAGTFAQTKKLVLAR